MFFNFYLQSSKIYQSLCQTDFNRSREYTTRKQRSGPLVLCQNTRDESTSPCPFYFEAFVVESYCTVQGWGLFINTGADGLILPLTVKAGKAALPY